MNSTPEDHTIMQTILAVGSSLFILHDFCINIHVCCNSYVNCTVQTANASRKRENEI